MLTNKFNLPQPFVDAVTRNYEYKDKQYSVTSLLKGTCQVMLERRHHHEVEQDVSDMIWLIFGTAVHKVLEDAQESLDQLKEDKIVVNVGDYKLSGIFDLYDEKLKKVIDYKTGSCWKVIYNDWEDYRKQLLMYAWMLKRIGFDCTSGEIVIVLKDWSSTKAKLDASYPQHAVHVQKFEFTMLDLIQIDEFIKDKFKEFEHCEKMPDNLLVPCTMEERWQEPTKYAVKKKGGKRAIKLYDNKEDALARCESEGLEFEVRPSVPKKCEEYCSVNGFCPFYKEYLKTKND